MSLRSKKRGGVHHIVPSSRSGGGGDNIFPDNRWPNNAEEDHDYWHMLADNMRPDEVVRKLREYTNRDGTINERFFYVRFRVSGPWKDRRVNPKIRTVEKIKPSSAKKRRNAWSALFRDMKVREVIDWIEDEFIQKVWLNPASQ